MGAPTSEVGYTSAKTGRGDHEVHKGHVVALEKKYTSPCVSYYKAIIKHKAIEHNNIYIYYQYSYMFRSREVIIGLAL
jgi:hypothetical protein